ncbi:hypothetical protein ACQP2P_01540 [Dactylosporangium sp. CA-139114]|uniref:hypothetical protein n=1 Tax=Dactylosporangium sp. CA-139114 TaxID=3239931 RepID=UPI003D95E62B
MRKPFPVIDVRPLEPPGVSAFGMRRRRLGDIPVPGDGAVLVFLVDGRYQQLPGGRNPRPGDHLVVAARGVAVVDMRPRSMLFDLPIASPRAGRDLHLRLGIRCRVVDPCIVAQQGLRDVAPELLTYFAEDQRLRWTAAGLADRTVNEVFRVVSNRVAARFVAHPLTVPGMEFRLAEIRLSTR